MGCERNKTKRDSSTCSHRSFDDVLFTVPNWLGTKPPLCEWHTTLDLTVAWTHLLRPSHSSYAQLMTPDQNITHEVSCSSFRRRFVFSLNPKHSELPVAWIHITYRSCHVHQGTEDQNKLWTETQSNVSEITVPAVCPPHMECYGMEPWPWQRDSDDLRFESSDGLSNPIKNEKSG